MKVEMLPTVDAGVEPQLPHGVVDGGQLVEVFGVIDRLRRLRHDVLDDLAERHQLLTYHAHLPLDPVVARRAL